MTLWQPYPKAQGSTVVGDLRVWQGLHSPQLNNERDMYVWLPSDYESTTRRYPVLYMHDAQNLFDKVNSYSGDSEWEVDETMTALTTEGLGAVVVALPNMREQRGLEYCPYPFTTYEGEAVIGQGDAYVRFIIETVKPVIDRTFRTQPDAPFTGIIGSSMGGLISLYGALVYPEVFGLCGAFSPAYWFGGNALLRTAQENADYPGRLYIDIGTREGETLTGWLGLTAEDGDHEYVRGVRDLYATVKAGGCATMMYVEEEGALHREAAWARRLPAALRFLLAETRSS
ncbi:MAG: alpha/beta hydrolase-fold protein [Chloroflexota bacterium]|nr:alpha/beta hydrolase-fold protein [Chloroflexota bacterium]